MESRTLTLDVPEVLYHQWEQQPDPVRATALQLAVQALRDYLKQESGRKMLLQLPERAYEVQDTPPTNLAEQHDVYLYEENDDSA